MTRTGAKGEFWCASWVRKGAWWWWEGRRDGGSGRALAEWGRVGSDSSSSFLIPSRLSRCFREDHAKEGQEASIVNVYRKYFMLVLPASACRSRSDLRLTLRLHAHTSHQGYLNYQTSDIQLGGVSKYE